LQLVRVLVVIRNAKGIEGKGNINLPSTPEGKDKDNAIEKEVQHIAACDNLQCQFGAGSQKRN
jgi:hypothetical protein